MVRVVLAVLLLLPLWAAAQDAPELQLEAPPSLQLGADNTAVVRFRAPPELRAQLYTNAGHFEAAEPAADGFWQARYVPPSTRYPQVAIVALVSHDGSQLAWTRMALLGTATVELHSDPRVQVYVRVAGAEFGPVTTDAAGRAALAVVVPPGVGRAVSRARDALGNERTESIPLNVPELTPLLSVCAPDNAHDALVFAARQDGKVAKGLPLTAAARLVTVRGISAESPGVYRVAFDIPAQARVGDLAALSVAVRGRAAAVSSCELPLPLERPLRVEVQLSRLSHRAGEREPIVVRVVPHYEGAREKAAIALSFVASLGALSESALTVREPAQLTWTLPEEFAGRSRAQLRLRGELPRGSVSMLEVELAPGPVFTLNAELAARRLPADGRSETVLRVRASDRYGNPAVAELTGEARGQLSSFHEVGSGQYEASYRAPLGLSGSDRIHARDGGSGVSASSALELYERGTYVALAARAGYLTNFARVSGPLAVVEVGYRLPVWQERVRLSALGGYYQSGHDVPTDDAGTTLDVGLWAVPLMLRADYTFVLGALELGPVIGGGVLSAASRVQSLATGRWAEHELVPLWAAGAHAALPWGSGLVCVELAYWAAVLHQTLVSGNAGGANLSLGYELPL